MHRPGMSKYLSDESCEAPVCEGSWASLEIGLYSGQDDYPSQAVKK